MITRIVRMSFREDEIFTFLEIFRNSKDKIRLFDGCAFLSLLRDTSDGSVFCTLSRWESEEHLNLYRKSELFKTTWAKTKVLFKEKAVAFSLAEYELVVD